MATVAGPTEPPSPSPPVAPTAEAWLAISQAERERFVNEVNATLSDPRLAMSDGRPHHDTKSRAVDMLGLHFGAIGHVIYLADELSITYPGEAGFSPDVFAVVDVPQIEPDLRMAWVVVDEKKGLDFVLEVLHMGDRTKDLVDNVERYARLGIPEYFVYDRAQQRILGYRLESPDARRYQRIVPRFGRHHSMVLGLDLAIERAGLRCFYGMAELFGSASLISRLRGIISSFESKAEAETAAAEQARANADGACAILRAAIFTLLDARGVPCSAEARASVGASSALETLQRWLLRATTASDVTQLFAE